MSQVVGRKVDAPVYIHPEVVFSVWDHIKRSKTPEKESEKIIGALMGCYYNNTLEITSSFAVPYDELKEKNSIWYFDADYVKLFADKLNHLDPNYYLVGWYHNGDQIVSADIQIHNAFSDMIEVPVLLLFDFNKKDSLPIKGYIAAEKVRSDGTSAVRGFDYIKCEYVYDSAEEMSIAQLKRNIPRDNIGILTRFMMDQFSSMNNLTLSLETIITYLTFLIEKTLPINNQIVFQVQSLMNQLFLVNHTAVSTVADQHHNDNLVVMFMAVLCRNVILLNELLNNRLLNVKKQKDASAKFFESLEKNEDSNQAQPPTTQEQKPTTTTTTNAKT